MPAIPRILGLSGSIRRESLNTRLLHVAATAIRAAGGETTILSLRDFSLPLFDADLEDEAGLPAAAQALIEEIRRHDGLLIASPEYNGSITPLLKNTVDWCSRADDNPFTQKVVAVVSASPGPFGGVRSFTQVRQLLLHLGAWVVPVACSVGQADQAFSPEGSLVNPRTQKTVDTLARSLVEACRRWSPQG